MTAPTKQVRSARRSLLFVPGARPDRFDKAARSKADIVCIDLEDAVPPHAKTEARSATLDWIAATAPTPGREFALRCNGIKTLAGINDLISLADTGLAPGMLVLPKVDSADEVRWVDALLTEAGCATPLMALIESVDGLENVHAIAAASPRLEILMFGAADLSAELGVSMDHEPLLYARSRCVHAARRAGIGLMDVPTLDFRNDATVAGEAARAKSLGFTGKAALHPGNIETVNGCFTPSAEEVAKAKEIIGLYTESTTGLVVLDGKLIEAPVIRAMRNVLDIAELTGAA